MECSPTIREAREPDDRVKRESRFTFHVSRSIQPFQHATKPFHSRAVYAGFLCLAQRLKEQTLQFERTALFKINQRRSLVIHQRGARAFELRFDERNGNFKTKRA